MPSLQESRQNVRDLIASLTMVLDTMEVAVGGEKEISALLHRKEVLDESIKNTQGRLAEAEQIIKAQIQKAQADADAKVKTLEVQVKAMEDLLASLKAQHESAKDKFQQELGNERVNFQREKQALQNSINDLNRQVSQRAQELSHIETAIAEARRKIA